MTVDKTHRSTVYQMSLQWLITPLLAYY